MVVHVLNHLDGVFLSRALEAGLCDKKKEKEKRHTRILIED